MPALFRLWYFDEAFCWCRRLFYLSADYSKVALGWHSNEGGIMICWLNSAQINFSLQEYGSIGWNLFVLHKTAVSHLNLNWQNRILTNYLGLMAQLKAHHSLPFNDLTFANFANQNISIADILS